MGRGERSGPATQVQALGAQVAGTTPAVGVNRLVVKVGTSTLTDPQGRLDRAFIADLTTQLAAQRAQGRDVLLVTSGAIRAGREILAKGAEAQASAPSAQTLNTLPYKQAAAAIGQGRLLHTYTEAFAWRNVECAQILLTRDDLSDRRRFLNARHTLRTLLALGVVPIINENDTVAVDEIKFGDNDHLAALVATLVEADLLLILSDVEGLYDRSREETSRKAHEERKEGEGSRKVAKTQREEEEGESFPSVIPMVVHVDEAVLALAGGATSGVGTGGMRTKVEAARVATEAGIRTVIARGRRERVIAEVVAGKVVGTTFLPVGSASRLSARKRWIAHGARPRGSITVNLRAKEKLCSEGVSLLAVGITQVSGEFLSGDLIEVRDEVGEVFARGLTNYAAVEVRRVLGLRSEQFEEVLGYRGFDEVIHRDNLVIG
ncbi:MAG TPA: glutamate 5-kinase [Chthonomonadaceae bacterium]|nr:glutamate 5-kinase [Chthonomonadaceae bacterium]